MKRPTTLSELQLLLDELIDGVTSMSDDELILFLDLSERSFVHAFIEAGLRSIDYESRRVASRQ